MADGAREAGKLRVFISYSRDDFAFADQLVAALAVTGFEPTIDRHEISGGEDWKRRLGGLIREADTVVFVLSPASAQSSICAWEVDEAARLGKRILPVVCRPLAGTSPSPHLQSLNYVFFCADEEQPGTGFGTGLTNLVAALNTDLDWLREHTRLLQRATEWESARRPDNRLLSGADIEEAKAWVARQPRGAPQPTPLHLDFIRASEAAEQARVSAEGQRLAEMAAAQDARAKALAEAEKAVAREAEAQRDRARAQRVIMWGSASAALVLAGVAVFAWLQRYTAKAQYLRAETAISAAMEGARDLTEFATGIRDTDSGSASKDIDDPAGATKDIVPPRPVARRILIIVHGIIDDLVAAGEASQEHSLAANLEKQAEFQFLDGDRAGGLANYEKALGHREKLAAADPGNLKRQSDLSVALLRAADLRRAAGNSANALPLYKKALSIHEKVALGDPVNAQTQRSIGIDLERIGSVLRDRGDYAGALANFQRSLAIYEKLAALDPGDTRYPVGTAIALERIASVHRAQGNLPAALTMLEKSHALYEWLAAGHPASSQWQSNFASSLVRVASLRRDMNDREGALPLLEKSHAIYEKLAADQPASLQWQSNFASSLMRIAELRRDMNDRQGALPLMERSHVIYERLAADQPTNIQWQSSFASSLMRIAELRGQMGDREGALAAYRRRLPIREKLAALTEEDEVKSDGRAGPKTARALNNVSWVALFNREFAKALAAGERAHFLDPNYLSAETNHAHALLFLERTDEARAIYIAHKGKKWVESRNEAWEQVIAKDFAVLRQMGLEHPMMAGIEAELGTVAPAQ
jgi:tetratricopeptide (TPR) repeat protein